MKPKRLQAWLAGVVLLLISLPAGSAAAHTGGKMQLASEAAGPYKLTVWTSPEPASVGELHVAVAVVLAEDASPVLDAGVFVQLESLEDAALTIAAEATAEDATNKFLREAIFELTSAGSYLATITINGVDGASGSATFDIQVAETAGLSWPLLLLGLILAAGVVVLIWGLLSNRSQRA
jgi:hypothetical protein